jgi:hypothetical protein
MISTHERLPLANSLRTNDVVSQGKRGAALQVRTIANNFGPLPFSDSVAVLPPILIRHVIAWQSVALPDRKPAE